MLLGSSLLMKLPVLHPESWAFDLVEGSRVEAQDTCVLLCGMWSIWNARNYRRHEGKDKSLKHCVQWAVDTAFDLWRTGAEAGRIISPKPMDCWRPPDSDVVMVNVDGAFQRETNHGASAAIMRDKSGALIAAKARWYPAAASALTMEASAIRDGIKMAWEMRRRKVSIVTDSQSICKMWSKGDFGRSEGPLCRWRPGILAKTSLFFPFFQ